MKKIGYFVGVAVAAFALSNAQAVELVAEWSDFSGLTADTPLKPSRGVEAGDDGVWTLSLNGGSVQDGALFTGTGAAPAINFNGEQHQIGGTGLGGFTVVVEIEPATSFVANKPIWMFHEAGSGANGQGIALTAASQIRGIWGNAIWENDNFPITDVDFTSPSTVVTTCGGTGTVVYWNGSSVRTAGNLKGGTMGGGDSLIYFGNTHGATEGGNNFKISHIAVFNGVMSAQQAAKLPWKEIEVFEVSDEYSVPSGVTQKDKLSLTATGSLVYDAANLNTDTNATSRIHLWLNPTLNANGTIKIANAASLQPGNYLLMDWEDWENSDLLGYGKPQLVLDGYTGDMSRVLLVPEVYKLWLQIISDEQAARPVLTIEPIGDSITEGLNNQDGSGKNYRIPLLNKLSLAGYNVASVGYWNKSAGGSKVGAFDPSGDTISDPAWTYHSGKGSMRAGAKSGNGTVVCQALNAIDIGGAPDIVLLHIGINDMLNNASGHNDPNGEQTFSYISNIVVRVLTERPDVKLVMSSPMCNEYGHGQQQAMYEGDSGKTDVNRTFCKPLHQMCLDFYNAVKRGDLLGKVEGAADRLFFADHYTNVMPRWYGNQPDTFLNDGSDHCHPNWLGHEKMAQGWFEQIVEAFPDPNPVGGFNAARADKGTPVVGALANVPEEYRGDFRLVRVIEPGATEHFLKSATREEIYDEVYGGVANPPRIAYYVEYVRETSTTNLHRFVWADMDSFANTIDEMGLPTATTKQQVVNNLHIYSNSGAVFNVDPSTSGVRGFIEFTPYNYGGKASSVEGAPADWNNCYDWNDDLSGTSEGYGSMQLHRIFDTEYCNRAGQIVFAYNKWGESNQSAASEFGIGDFHQSFSGVSIDWTNTSGYEKVDSTSMSVRRIEIWAYAPHRAPSMIIK